MSHAPNNPSASSVERTPEPAAPVGALALATGSTFCFCPAPGHYTRENWLAYRIIAQLSESGLDINTSPAVQVWDVAHCEIIAWMQEHGIKTGLRPQERESSSNTKLTHD